MLGEKRPITQRRPDRAAEVATIAWPRRGGTSFEQDIPPLSLSRLFILRCSTPTGNSELRRETQKAYLPGGRA